MQLYLILQLRKHNILDKGTASFLSNMSMSEVLGSSSLKQFWLLRWKHIYDVAFLQVDYCESKCVHFLSQNTYILLILEANLGATFRKYHAEILKEIGSLKNHHVPPWACLRSGSAFNLGLLNISTTSLVGQVWIDLESRFTNGWIAPMALLWQYCQFFVLFL